MQVKKQQLEPDMKQWTGSKLGKEYVLSCLFKLRAEYIMQNAGLDETQARIKIAERNIDNLNMPANLENSAVATGLEKDSFHSNPKARQCQTMFKLSYSCTHLTR